MSAAKLRPFPEPHGIRRTLRPQPFFPRGVRRWIKRQTELKTRRVLRRRLPVFRRARLCVKIALLEAQRVRLGQESAVFQRLFVDAVSRRQVGAGSSEMGNAALGERQLDFHRASKESCVLLACADLLLQRCGVLRLPLNLGGNPNVELSTAC